MTDTDIQIDVEEFFIENNINHVSDDPRSSDNIFDYLDILIDLNSHNPLLIDYLREYISLNLDVNFDRLKDNFFDSENLEILFDRADAYQLYNYIDYKTTSIISRDISVTSNRYKLKPRDGLYYFEIPIGTKLLYYREKVGNFDTDYKGLREFSFFSPEAQDLEKLYESGYYYIYENLEPLTCVYISIENLGYHYDILNLEAMEKDKAYMENYLLELLGIDGISQKNSVSIATKSIKHLSLVQFKQVTNVIELYGKVLHNDKKRILTRLLNEDRNLLRLILKEYDIPKDIVNSVTKSGVENISLRPRNVSKINFQVINIRASPKNQDILDRFANIIEEQQEFFPSLAFALNYLNSYYKDYYSIAYREVDDEILVYGILNYFVIGNIYFIRSLKVRINDNSLKAASGLIKNLKERASKKNIETIIVQDMGSLKFVYFMERFRPLPHHEDCFFWNTN